MRPSEDQCGTSAGASGARAAGIHPRHNQVDDARTCAMPAEMAEFRQCRPSTADPARCCKRPPPTNSWSGRRAPFGATCGSLPHSPTARRKFSRHENARGTYIACRSRLTPIRRLSSHATLGARPIRQASATSRSADRWKFARALSPLRRRLSSTFGTRHRRARHSALRASSEDLAETRASAVICRGRAEASRARLQPTSVLRLVDQLVLGDPRHHGAQLARRLPRSGGCRCVRRMALKRGRPAAVLLHPVAT